MIYETLADIGEEAPLPEAPPTSLVGLSKAIEDCFEQGFSALEVLNYCNRSVLGEPIPNMCSATSIAHTTIAMLMRNRQDSGNKPQLLFPSKRTVFVRFAQRRHRKLFGRAISVLWDTMQKLSRQLRYAIPILFIPLVLAPLVEAVRNTTQPIAVSRFQDWSSLHVIYSRTGTAAALEAARHDPRAQGR